MADVIETKTGDILSFNWIDADMADMHALLSAHTKSTWISPGALSLQFDFCRNILLIFCIKRFF